MAAPFSCGRYSPFRNEARTDGLQVKFFCEYFSDREFVDMVSTIA